MNPYDFVRTDWTKPPERRGPIFHHKFDGVSGKIECQLIAETLIFIPTSELDQSSRGIFSTHRNEYGMLDSGAYFIPGSSLKGLFRSLVEVVGNGCYSIFDGKYEKDKVYYVDKISTDFKKCENLNSLCIGCRLFGFLKANKVYKGLVQISDADFIAGEEYGKFILHSIGGPNPRHDAFYLDEKKEQLSGRKFYFHSMKQLSGQEGDFNAPTIYPLKAGALFHFNIHFNNLTQSELDTLLYAIVLEENMRHKIGYAKPFGFGSVKIEIDQLTIIDRMKRYSKSENEQQILSESSLDQYLDHRLANLRKNQSIAFQDLRRIWAWPPPKGVQFNYPSYEWFKEAGNSQIRLHELE